MRSAIAGALVLLAACGPAGAPAPEPGTTAEERLATMPPQPLPTGATFVFYNTENLFDTIDDTGRGDDDLTPLGRLAWTGERYRTKLQRLGEAVRLSGDAWPVLVGLAEVENRGVVEDLSRGADLLGAHYTVVHFDSPDERGIDVALLVDPGHYRVAASAPIAVELPGDRTRDILHATLHGATDTLEVFVNHWPSRREGEAESAPKRMAAATTLRKAVESLPERHRVLIMGDLNDTPLDRSVQEGLGAGCSRQAALVDLMCLDQPEGRGSHQYQGEWAYLDQFIVDRDLLAHVEGAAALWDERLLFRHPRYGLSPDKTYSGDRYKGGYSDHLPVVLRLK
ncbi:MAG: hypothetical protein JNL05_15520 [Flavobacteriales bacterium]|nr:hypothetical protein [Flavobacteriales bacterium]